MDFLPISIRISDQQILIIGGGKVALHKIELLKRFTSRFKVIASKVLPEIKEMNAIEIEERPYREGDLKGFLLVYVATDNHSLNLKIKQDSIPLNCIVNLADNPRYSDFVSPAIILDDEVTVSVGSDGKDVHKSIRIRNKLKAFLLN